MVWDRQKRQKLFKIHRQNAYIWSEIYKTVFKIFLTQILRKLQIHGVNGDGRQEWRKRQKSFKIHSYNAYVWSEISKTVFKIVIAQILRKLQIYGVNGGGRQEWRLAALE